MSIALNKLRALAAALVEQLGAGWTFAEGLKAPQLGLGAPAEGRIVVFIDRGEAPSGRRGCALWRSERRYHWLVDDGQGLTWDGAGSSIGKMVGELWRTLWRATRTDDQVLELVAQMLTDATARERWDWKAQTNSKPLEAMGAAEVGAPGLVRWGRGETALHFTIYWQGYGVGDGFPFLQSHIDHDVSIFHLRRRWSSVELAERAATIMIRYAEAMLGGETPSWDASGWLEARAEVPAAPAELKTSATPMAAFKRKEWEKRLRAWLKAETDDARRLRLRRHLRLVGPEDQQDVAEHQAFLPGEGLDELGRAKGWGGAPQGTRSPVPVKVIAGLWLLGLPVRAIATITTGTDKAKSSVSRRLKEVRPGSAPDGWTAHGRRALVHEVVGWACPTAEQLAAAETPRRRTQRAALSSKGADDRPRIRVRRRTPEVDPAAFVVSLPARHRALLLELVYLGDATEAELVELLNVSSAAALKGCVSSLGRWASKGGLSTPFERQGDTLRWIGGPSWDGWAEQLKAIGRTPPLAVSPAAGGTDGTGRGLPQTWEQMPSSVRETPAESWLGRRLGAMTWRDLEEAVIDQLASQVGGTDLLRLMGPVGHSNGWLTWGKSDNKGYPGGIFRERTGDWIEVVLAPAVAYGGLATRPVGKQPERPGVQHGGWWRQAPDVADVAALAQWLSATMVERAANQLGVIVPREPAGAVETRVRAFVSSKITDRARALLEHVAREGRVSRDAVVEHLELPASKTGQMVLRGTIQTIRTTALLCQVDVPVALEAGDIVWRDGLAGWVVWAEAVRATA